MVHLKYLFIPILLAFTLSSCSTRKPKEDSAISAESLSALADDSLSGTLTVATVYNTDRIKGAAKEFMKKNPGVEIVINEYPTENEMDEQKFIESMTSAIQNGQAEDIIDSTFLNTGILADQNLLTDFYSLMLEDENFSFDDYYTVFFDMMVYNGGLYALPTTGYCYYIVINQNAPEFIISQFKELECINYEEMLNLYKLIPERFYFEVYYNPQKVLSYEYSRFINVAKRSCDFENSAFIQCMQTYKEISELKNPGKESEIVGNYFIPDTFDDQQYLFKVVSIFQLQYFLPYSENSFIYPVPLSNAEGNVVGDSVKKYVIPSSSDNKELAWEFLEFMLSGSWLLESPVYTFDFGAINRSNFRSNVEKSLNEFIDNSQRESNVFLPDGMLQSECVSSIADALEAQLEVPMLNNTASYLAGDIIEQEFDAFLNGFITAEQAAANIQSKLSSALQE